MSFNKLIQQLKGGSGSGNFGHAGIPGKVGGSAPGSGGSSISTETLNTLNNMATDDYQKRGDKYPRSGVPDTIDVYDSPDKISVRADFKGTSELDAEAWLRHQLRTKIGEVATAGQYKTRQSGDYDDDWVTATAVFDKV